MVTNTNNQSPSWRTSHKGMWTSGHSDTAGLLPWNDFISQSVQLLSRVRLFVTPWTVARQASLSITNSRSSLKLTSVELVMLSNHFILCRPLLLLPSIFPSIRVFSKESVLRIKWPKYWSFRFSISPSNEHPGLISFRMDWLDLLAVQGTVKSLLQHHSPKHQFYEIVAVPKSSICARRHTPSVHPQPNSPTHLNQFTVRLRSLLWRKRRRQHTSVSSLRRPQKPASSALAKCMYSQLSLSTDTEPTDPGCSLYYIISYEGLEHGRVLDPIFHGYKGWIQLHGHINPFTDVWYKEVIDFLWKPIGKQSHWDLHRFTG